MPKRLETSRDKDGYNVEVYHDDVLIDWRRGLTSAGQDQYVKHYNEHGYLAEGTRDVYDIIANSTKFEHGKYKIHADFAVGEAKASLVITTKKGERCDVPQEMIDAKGVDFLITPCNEGQPLNYGEHVQWIAPAVERLLSLMFSLQGILTQGSFTSGRIEFTNTKKEYVEYMLYYNGEGFEFQKLN